MTIRTARFRLTLAAIALTILSPALAGATRFSWTSTGGEFDAAANWTQSGAPADFDGIPDASDIVVFNRGNVTLYPVIFGDLLVPNSDIHPTVDKVVIGTNPLSFAGFHGSTLTADSTNITETGRGVVIGLDEGDVAALTSTLATFDTQYATLGSAAGSSGTLNLTSASAGAFSVSGTGATYDLIVGLNGTGTINVTNGRDVTVADDTVLGQNATGVGNVTVSGAGSTWTSTGDLTVGGAGSGILNLSGGADVAVGGVVLVGTNGTVNFSDASSTWSSGAVVLFGTFNIANGATFSNTEVSLSGTLAVTGVGSSWITGGAAEPNGGTVNISNGGSVLDSANSLLPFSGIPTGSVNVNVSSGGSLLTGASSINSHASLQPGRRVSVTGADSVWQNIGRLDVFTGEITVSDGGRFEYVGEVRVNSGNVAVQGTGAIMQPNGVGVLYVSDGGTLTVSDSGTASASSIIVGAFGEIHGDGNIVGVLENGGLVSPGNSPGALNMNGNYTQLATGELLIDLAASSYDQLLITGTATLDGTLTVNLLDGFIPNVGQMFTILTADDVNGEFIGEPVSSVPNLGFDVIYNAQSVVLTVLSALPGDYNGNGTVDAADYTLWRDNLGGSSLPNESASLGIVDEMDYDFWKLHFGDTVGSGSGDAGSAGAAVPEPTSFAWMMAAMCGMILAARRPSGRRQRCPFYRLRLIVN